MSEQEEQQDGPATAAYKALTKNSNGKAWVAGSGVGGLLVAAVGFFFNAVLERMDRLDAKLGAVQTEVVKLQQQERRFEELADALDRHIEQPGHRYAERMIGLLQKQFEDLEEDHRELKDRVKELENENR